MIHIISLILLACGSSLYSIQVSCEEWSASQTAKMSLLNRVQNHHISKMPPIPQQTRNYLHIANYNIRSSNKDIHSVNAWQMRKKLYIQILQNEDEARKMMELMRSQLKVLLTKHFHETTVSDERRNHLEEKDCTTCCFTNCEPMPILETHFFRLALKCQYNREGELTGNFPYPYRMIIALKRHAPHPSLEEWQELSKILRILQDKVGPELGAEYCSYSCLQDVYYQKKAEDKPVPKEPHFLLHFFFRFPKGIQIGEVTMDDPNPYEQAVVSYPNIIAPLALKPQSSHVYRKMPDILNIQELQHEQTKDLKEALPNYTFIGYTAFQGLSIEDVGPDTWIGEIVAIAFNTSRLKCLKSGMRWLSSTPDKPSLVPGASRERIIIWGLFQDKITGRQFYMFNTHYDHLCQVQLFVEAELNTIKTIAGDELWFSAGERFYKDHDGEALYKSYTEALHCHDVRDCSLLGHYGQAGSWGGFDDDSYAVPLKNGLFGCDTLDVCFTNCKRATVLLTYAFSGACHSTSGIPYSTEALIKSEYRLASDHFMTGFYAILQPL